MKKKPKEQKTGVIVNGKHIPVDDLYTPAMRREMDKWGCN